MPTNMYKNQNPTRSISAFLETLRNASFQILPFLPYNSTLAEKSYGAHLQISMILGVIYGILNAIQHI